MATSSRQALLGTSTAIQLSKFNSIQLVFTLMANESSCMVASLKASASVPSHRSHRSSRAESFGSTRRVNVIGALRSTDNHQYFRRMVFPTHSGWELITWTSPNQFSVLPTFLAAHNANFESITCLGAYCPLKFWLRPSIRVDRCNMSLIMI